MRSSSSLILVNFGGPRNKEEIAPFLTELLTDRDVVRTPLPSPLHRLLFTRIARKRAQKIGVDYDAIGGRSPIYFDTEEIGNFLRRATGSSVVVFHRYLPSTHRDTLRQIESCPTDQILVLPLFPQFCYATTGSIARFFAKRLCCRTLDKLRWIHSYAAHPSYIAAFRKRIADFLQQQQLVLSETLLLFSAHGVPRSFSCEGDPYESECRLSFDQIRAAFPEAAAVLSFQSKFGKGEWLRPYTDETCAQIRSIASHARNVVVVPLSFTSDHIETLFEIEFQYLPILRSQGVQAFRCPALNLEPYWLSALPSLLQSPPTTTAMLIRNPAYEDVYKVRFCRFFSSFEPSCRPQIGG
jgi:ferrochelatase